MAQAHRYPTIILSVIVWGINRNRERNAITVGALPIKCQIVEDESIALDNVKYGPLHITCGGDLVLDIFVNPLSRRKIDIDADV